MIAQGRIAVKVADTDVAVTGLAGLPVLVNLAHETGLMDDLDGLLPAKQRPRLRRERGGPGPHGDPVDGGRVHRRPRRFAGRLRTGASAGACGTRPVDGTRFPAAHVVRGPGGLGGGPPPAVGAPRPAYRPDPRHAGLRRLAVRLEEPPRQKVCLIRQFGMVPSWAYGKKLELLLNHSNCLSSFTQERSTIFAVGKRQCSTSLAKHQA